MTKFHIARFDAQQLAALDPAQRALMLSCCVWKNDVYQVCIRRAEAPADWPGLVHVSIKRLDREPIHDWRDLQEIKNELVGKECEGVEIYPADSRLVDSANQYHLWVIDEPGVRFPFGFGERFVKDAGELEEAYALAKQRPFGQKREYHHG